MSKEYATQEGLNNVTYPYKNEDGQHFGKLRGYKKAGDINAIYETYWHYGNYSAIAVTAGGNAEMYPDSFVNNFFSSVKRIR